MAEGGGCRVRMSYLVFVVCVCCLVKQWWWLECCGVNQALFFNRMKTRGGGMRGKPIS